VEGDRIRGERREGRSCRSPHEPVYDIEKDLKK